jgi:hypothetical protein
MSTSFCDFLETRHNSRFLHTELIIVLSLPFSFTPSFVLTYIQHFRAIERRYFCMDAFKLASSAATGTAAAAAG